MRICHFSPHILARAVFKVSKPRRKPQTVSTRCLSRINMTAFHADLRCADWGDVFSAECVSDQWRAFLRTLITVIETHAPVRNIRIENPTAPTLTETTKSLVGSRRREFREQGRYSDVYRELNRAVRSAIRSDNRDDIDRRV